MDYQQHATVKLKRRLSPSAAIEPPDILSQLLRSENRGEGLTPDEVMFNSMLSINAASETMATTLTGVVNNLVQNPESLSTLEA
jgi:cytochrome P450